MKTTMENNFFWEKQFKGFKKKEITLFWGWQWITQSDYELVKLAHNSWCWCGGGGCVVAFVGVVVVVIVVAVLEMAKWVSR
jgi:hypothetical protein